MVPNFHDTSPLDVLMMLVYSLPAIIAAVAALLTIKGQQRGNTKLDHNTGLLKQNAEKVEEVHKLVNSTMSDMTSQRDTLQTEVDDLKEAATLQKGGARP